jgi:YbbR-like protein
MIEYIRNLFLRDFWLKLFSLALAVLIWLTVSFTIRKGGEPAGAAGHPATEPQRIFLGVPVQKMASAADVRSFKVSPGEVDVTVEGDTELMHDLRASDIRAYVDLTGIESARSPRQRVEVTTPAGVTYVRIVPEEVDVIVPPKP